MRELGSKLKPFHPPSFRPPSLQSIRPKPEHHSLGHGLGIARNRTFLQNREDLDDGIRTWYDAFAEYSMVAVLISKDQKEVTLRRKDGKVIKVPFDNLSEADLRYLKN